MGSQSGPAKASPGSGGHSHYESATIDVDDVNVIPHAEGVDPVAAADPQGTVEPVRSQQAGVALLAVARDPQGQAGVDAVDEQTGGSGGRGPRGEELRHDDTVGPRTGHREGAGAPRGRGPGGDRRPRSRDRSHRAGATQRLRSRAAGPVVWHLPKTAGLPAHRTGTKFGAHGRRGQRR